MFCGDYTRAIIENEPEVVILWRFPIECIVVVDSTSIKDSSSSGVENIEVDVVVCSRNIDLPFNLTAKCHV